MERIIMSRGLINKVLKRLTDQAELSKLLWSSDATGNFPAQTVSLDLSKYDFVDIAVKFLGEAEWDAPANMTAVCRCKVGARGALSIVHLNTDTAQNATNFINIVTRLATVSNTGVIFTSGQMTYAGGAYANWANRCVPYRIWGIKSRGGGRNLPAYAAYAPCREAVAA